MKKKLILLLAVFCLIPAVKAAELNVKTLSASNKDNTITYSGTTDEGVLAVSCSLFNSKDEEIDISSNSVDNSKFEGKFTVSKNDTYTVKCANYEGGKIISASTEAKEVKNPQTGDNIVKFLMIGAISVVGIVGLGIYIKKNSLD